MTPVHVHLALNHVPLIGVVLGLMLLAFGRLRRSEELALAALITFVLVGALAAATYFSGEAAEDVVEHLAGVSAERIEAHEESALLSTLAAAGLGMLALAELVLLRMRAVPHWIKSLTFGGAVGVAALMTWTAWLGAWIRHTELDGRVPAAAPDERVAPQRGTAP